MNIKLPSPTSPSLWALLASVAGIVLPNIGLGTLSTPAQAVITAVGGLVLAVVSWHHVGASVARKSPPPAGGAGTSSSSGVL